MRGAIAKKSTKDGDWRQVFPDRAGAWSLLLNKESVHDGTVEVLVLEGQFQVGPIVYGPGDYFCVPGGVVHGPERALTDVRIVVISHGPLTPGP